METNQRKFRVGAVSYLNTVPLVWGMMHGPQRDEVDLSFSIPSVCAGEVAENAIELGLVPVAEAARQNLEVVPGVGITCLGAVRSILLLARCPWEEVRTLAADWSSRTSVELARVILRERFGVEPEITAREPHAGDMLRSADAALVIGDAALRIDPERVSWRCLDLGAEWFALTGLPMVFALWAGKPGLPVQRLEAITRGSYLFGKNHLAEITQSEYRARGISLELAEQYLHSYIRYEIGPKEQDGLNTFLSMAGLPTPALAAKV